MLTVNTSKSTSVSFASINPFNLDTVNVVSSLIEPASGFAIGASFTAVIVITSFAVATSPFPSLII